MGLKIERIYEHGEILAYPRLLLLILAEGTAGRRTDDAFLPVSPLSIDKTGRCRAGGAIASAARQ